MHAFARSPSPPGRKTSRPDLARGRLYHDRVDLTENNIDATGNAGHNSAGRDSDEPSHERVLDEVLTCTVLPNPTSYRKPN